MSQRDGFTGGFLLGALLGGLVGGTIGALAASRRQEDAMDGEPLPPGTASKEVSEERIEMARRSLEAKIAQLNLAIDDVREQLSSVNGNGQEVERDS